MYRFLREVIDFLCVNSETPVYQLTDKIVKIFGSFDVLCTFYVNLLAVTSSLLPLYVHLLAWT